jgi:hypothetical protein
MHSYTIPVSVKTRAQRTLKLVGFGFKSFLTTKVSGKLIVRKKVNAGDVTQSGILPWRVTPPKPHPKMPKQPPVEAAEGLYKAMPTDWPEDLHQNLVSNGIKVRDFAYPATRVGHTKPIDPLPMAIADSEESGAKVDEIRTYLSVSALLRVALNSHLQPPPPKWSQCLPCL